MSDTSQAAYNWLNKTFESRENGIFVDSKELASFEAIQNFIAAHDCPKKTPVIYYQAFADEDLNEFLETLEEELRLKLGYGASESCVTMSEVIKCAELQAVAIDRSHLYSAEMLERLSQWLASNQISLILIISQAELDDSAIVKHPVISQWERFFPHRNLPFTLVSKSLNLSALGG